MEFKNYLFESISNLQLLDNAEFIETIDSAAKLMLKTLSLNKSILVCGNGGSHSDAQHFAGELVNYFSKEHKALKVIALGTNTAVATAWSNDHSFDDQFAREVEAYGEPGSLLFGITTSGKSKNVNLAFARAHSMGMKVIALTSAKAIKNLSEVVDIVIPVPVTETHKIQECHLVIYHALCILIENSLPNQYFE